MRSILDSLVLFWGDEVIKLVDLCRLCCREVVGRDRAVRIHLLLRVLQRGRVRSVRVESEYRKKATGARVDSERVKESWGGIDQL